MKINRGNYEEYALDYLEGMLSTEAGREFEKFLDGNPDIAAQIGALGENMPVAEVDDRVVFPGKDKLVKRRSSFRMLYYCGAAAAVLLACYMVLNREEGVVVPDGMISGAIMEPVKPAEPEKKAVVERAVEPGTAPVAGYATQTVAVAKSVKTTVVAPGSAMPELEKIEPVVGSGVKLALNTSALGYDTSSGAIAADVAYSSSMIEQEPEPGPAIAAASSHIRSNNLLGTAILNNIAAIDGLRTMNELISLKVYINDFNERVVEFASVTISRRQLENYN